MRKILNCSKATYECGIRSEEMWETLVEQYSGSANMIDRNITVLELREKIGRTSVIHLGFLNSTHTPMNSNTHHIRVRAGFNDLCRKYWEDAKPESFCAVPGNNTDSKIVEICGTLTKIMRQESLHFGYALRRHNAKYKNEDASMILTQHVLEDWASDAL